MTITYQVEPWTPVWRELEPLWSDHWVEVATNRDKIKLDVDFAAYETYEKAGALHVVTARQTGEVIGYHISIVRPHLHYRSSLSAFADVYFIHSDYRKGRVGIELFKFMEKSLKARGVEKLFTGTKLSLDMGRLFEHLGWSETERLYTKYIGEG